MSSNRKVDQERLWVVKFIRLVFVWVSTSPGKAAGIAEGAEYTEQLHQDFAIRKLIHKEAEKAGVSRVEVERFPGKVKVVVHTAKPGILIGRKGDTVKKIRQDLEALTGKKIDLEIKEIKTPDTDALPGGDEYCRSDRTPCQLTAAR